VRRLGHDTQVHFAKGLQEMLDTLTALVAEQRAGSADSDETRREAIAFYNEMVGAVILSRSVASADPQFAEEILRASQQMLIKDFALDEAADKR